MSDMRSRAHKEDCAMCGEPMKGANPEETHLMTRANSILVGVLRHYSMLYYGTKDVTDLSGVAVEMKSASSDIDDAERQEFMDYVDSDDGKDGWKPPLAQEGWRFKVVVVVMLVGTWAILDAAKVIPDKQMTKPASVGGGGGAGGSGTI
eukprot:CAMPEP_0179009602 /NCGR_PEP_ID=MMETSP0795-20121207/16360_1 /TAXON_ID=88552 /ORGANISM="Amoebophrya sp., Strain Ameob2" /LENGTH=148 /DNA_ID=CAMNT_0020704811 /DNA_START=175 /DNA_END=621 /DNA_ORIENTATION=-